MTGKPNSDRHDPQCISGCASNASCFGGQRCNLSLEECVDTRQSNGSCNCNDVYCGQNSGCQTYGCIETSCPTQWNACVQ